MDTSTESALQFKPDVAQKKREGLLQTRREYNEVGKIMKCNANLASSIE